MKWLANLVTGGELDRLRATNERLRGDYSGLLAGFAGVEEERDGLQNRVDGLERTIVDLEAHRDRAVESVKQHCREIEAVEIDRDLSLAHAVRLYAIASKLHEDLAQAQEWCELAQATMEMGLRLARNLQASRAECDRRLDAATVRAEALSREVERQRGVIATLRQKHKPSPRAVQRRKKRRSRRKRR